MCENWPKHNGGLLMKVTKLVEVGSMQLHLVYRVLSSSHSVFSSQNLSVTLFSSGYRITSHTQVSDRCNKLLTCFTLIFNSFNADHDKLIHRLSVLHETKLFLTMFLFSNFDTQFLLSSEMCLRNVISITHVKIFNVCSCFKFYEVSWLFHDISWADANRLL